MPSLEGWPADDPGVGHGAARRHSSPARAGAHGVRGERLARAAYALTAIHGYLETLLSGALEDREHARRFLEIVFPTRSGSGGCSTDLTDLSNIELGRVI